MPQTIEWKKYFENRGIARNIRITYLRYIQKLQENKAPVIFENEHLALLTGINHQSLLSIINSTNSFYRSFKIPKRNSKEMRDIVVPYPSLMHIQKWINKEILNIQEVHFCAHGYVRKRSILTNAKKHVGKKVFFKIDLKDFFPNISINKVIKVFLNMGYTHQVAFSLAALCTLDKRLPQGAPTSPTLSNLIAKHMDSRLYKLAKKYNLDYSRYADDMALSGEHIPYKLKSVVFEIIEECGFEINEKKSYLCTEDKKRILTGLSISGKKAKLPRSTKRILKQEVYFIKKYGYFSHINKKKINNPYYLESLYGKLCFWKQVEPDSEDATKALLVIKDVMQSLRPA